MALLAQRQDQRHERPHAVDHAPQVDVDHTVPLVERDLPAVAAVHDAGVVHGDVQRPEAIERRLADGLHGALVPNVGNDGVHRGAGGVQPVAVDGQRVRVDVGHDHLRPLGHGCFHNGEADPAGRARHHHRAPLQFHRPSVGAPRRARSDDGCKFPSAAAGCHRAAMGEPALFLRDGASLVGTVLVQGGWSPTEANGGAVLALLGHYLEDVPSLVPMTIGRFTTDLMRPVPVGRRLQVATSIVREGKKIQVVSMHLLVDDVEHVRATVLRLREADLGEHEVPASTTLRRPADASATRRGSEPCDQIRDPGFSCRVLTPSTCAAPPRATE